MKNIFRAIIVSTTLAVSAAYANTADVIVRWNPPRTFETGERLRPSKDIIFYTVYYGSNKNNYDRLITVPANRNSVLIRNLKGTVYFKATATSTEFEESKFSNVIVRNFNRRYTRPIILLIDDENDDDDERKVCSGLQGNRKDDCESKQRESR